MLNAITSNIKLYKGDVATDTSYQYETVLMGSLIDTMPKRTQCQLNYDISSFHINAGDESPVSLVKRGGA